MVDHCRSILGGRAYSSLEAFPRAFEDLRALDLWEGTTDLLRMAVAMEGIIAFAADKEAEIRWMRNPLTFPIKYEFFFFSNSSNNDYPTNIASMHFVMGCPNARC